jgi:ubiquinone/menaquinone biosynthesis C-methylase UbiE
MEDRVSEYLLSNAWEREEERLADLEASWDPGTIGLLEDIGVGPGWRCLEAGAGHGSIARWLARRVGPDGRVVATDIDTRFLEGIDEPSLEVRRHDLVNDALEEESFDLVHTRLLLEHLSERDQAM